MVFDHSFQAAGPSFATTPSSQPPMLTCASEEVPVTSH